MQAGGEPPLAACPRCGQPVETRIATKVNSPRMAKPSSVSDAKAAGFTVLKRISSGEYEKQ